MLIGGKYRVSRFALCAAAPQRSRDAAPGARLFLPSHAEIVRRCPTAKRPAGRQPWAARHWIVRWAAAATGVPAIRAAASCQGGPGLATLPRRQRGDADVGGQSGTRGSCPIPSPGAVRPAHWCASCASAASCAPDAAPHRHLAAVVALLVELGHGCTRRLPPGLATGGYFRCAGGAPPAALLHALRAAIGAVVMRGAGCTINDMWDRDFDAKVRAAWMARAQQP